MDIQVDIRLYIQLDNCWSTRKLNISKNTCNLTKRNVSQIQIRRIFQEMEAQDKLTKLSSEHAFAVSHLMFSLYQIWLEYIVVLPYNRSSIFTISALN